MIWYKAALYTVLYAYAATGLGYFLKKVGRNFSF